MRNIIAAITLTLVLMVGTTFAGNGLLVSDIAGTEPTPCVDNGIVPVGFTGIVPVGFTGIVPVGFTSIIIFAEKTVTTDCGIVPVG
ncbi:MAG: hypothetical protein LUM44_18695 [Pyrinomonadaceae bacterium]|nr:hypothetical protein [Pyrinomonadaceae bacterium]